MVQMNCMGEEESQHHQKLLELEQTVTEAICIISRARDGQQQRAVRSERQIQDTLALMREHIRDLELLAEEQET